MNKLLIIILAILVIGGCATQQHGWHIQASPMGISFFDFDGKLDKEEIKEMLKPYLGQPAEPEKIVKDKGDAI